MAKNKKVSAQLCPCGSEQPLPRCCGPIVSGEHSAATAEALMRSRYTAYALGERDYLLETWLPATRPSALALDPAQRWIGLKISATEAGQAGDTEGKVTFVARYKVGGRAERLQECSLFRFVDGRWYYVTAL